LLGRKVLPSSLTEKKSFDDIFTWRSEVEPLSDVLAEVLRPGGRIHLESLEKNEKFFFAKRSSLSTEVAHRGRIFNGRESTVNRALDGSIYPG
jgi:hypothetical protein